MYYSYTVQQLVQCIQEDFSGHSGLHCNWQLQYFCRQICGPVFPQNSLTVNAIRYSTVQWTILHICTVHRYCRQVAPVRYLRHYAVRTVD